MKYKMPINLACFQLFAIITTAQVTPVLKGQPQVLGIVTDPELNRDSCGSALFGDRALWTCRDTQVYESNGDLNVSVVSNSASWTNFTSDGLPDLEPASANGKSKLLLMYGNNDGAPFFPYSGDECGSSPSGTCSDGTRYALWPDSPPMVVSNSPDTVLAYTWIKQAHLQGLTALVNDPATSLYRVEYTANGDVDALPVVSDVDETFWGVNQSNYGDYGNVVKDGVAYLYSHSSSGIVALARVSTGSVEDKSSYEYWVEGTGWTSTQPSWNASDINIANVTAGGQGTFYWSNSWKSYVWIGQESDSVSADFYITTAAEPQGPWAEPMLFWSGANGNSTLPAYSLQANPALVKEGNNEIYLTYTMDNSVDGNDIYTTPLIYVQWE